MIYKIKNYIIQANEVVFSTLLAGSITLVYHWYYLKTFLPFLDNKKLVEFRLPVRDGDYYLLTIERLADVFRSINPFTYSAITPQLNLHFAELIYFVPYSLGLSIESSYLIIQVLFTGLLLFTLSRFALNILQVKWIVTLFTSAFTFLVFPEVFVRPVSPTIHATFLFLYLYLVWITLMKQSQSRPLLTNLFGLIVGIGYPYFALWATLWSLFLTYLYMSQKNHEFSVSRFIKTFLALWLATAVNLTSTLFLGHHLDTHATTYLHFPTGYLRLIVSVGVILLILVLKKRNLTDIEKFLIASLFAPVAFLLSPTLTGRELEFNSHITFPYSYWMLLAMFYIIVKIWSMKFKGSKFALVVLIFAFLVTENSQMPLQDRFRASYTARTLIARENMGQLTTLKTQLPNLFTNQGVTSIPSELVSLLYGTPNFKILSHDYAGFDENDRKERIERYILNQQLQQSQVSVVYNNRELFGTRILNQCNRLRNFSKIAGFAGFTFDSSRACEISPNDLEQIREVEANISRGLLSYMKKYDVNFIISSSSTSLQKYPFEYEILFRTRDYVLLEILPFDR